MKCPSPSFVCIGAKPTDVDPCYCPPQIHQSVDPFVVPVVGGTVTVGVCNVLAWPVGFTVFISDGTDQAMLEITGTDPENCEITLQNYGSSYTAEPGSTLSGTVNMVLFGPKLSEDCYVLGVRTTNDIFIPALGESVEVRLNRCVALEEGQKLHISDFGCVVVESVIQDSPTGVFMARFDSLWGGAEAGDSIAAGAVVTTAESCLEWDNYTILGYGTYESPLYTPCCGEVDPCSVAIDVGFAIDASNSIDIGEWNLLRPFVRELAEQLEDASPAGGAEFGMSIFAANDRTALYHSMAPGADALMVSFNAYVRGGDAGTEVKDGIDLVADELTNNGRTGITKVVVLITDGVQANTELSALNGGPYVSTDPELYAPSLTALGESDDPELAADSAKSLGYTVIVVPIGVGAGPGGVYSEADVDAHLGRMASSASDVIPVDDFDQLDSKVAEIIEAICQ